MAKSLNVMRLHIYLTEIVPQDEQPENHSMMSSGREDYVYFPRLVESLTSRTILPICFIVTTSISPCLCISPSAVSASQFYCLVSYVTSPLVQLN